MSWWRRVLSGPDVDGLRTRADDLRRAGRPGEAKLVYERALDAARRRNGGGGDDELARELVAAVTDCRDDVARGRLDDAAHALSSGQAALARDYIDDAAEAAASAEAQRAVDEMRARLDRSEGERAGGVDEAVELTDEERLALLAASWTEAQQDEYEGYGQRIDRGLLALHDDDPATAREVFAEILTTAPHPVWLYLEQARACFAADDRDAGAEALRAFLAGVGTGDDATDARLAAHVELARHAHETEGFDAAVAEYERAIDALPEDYRGYLVLGQYLRAEGHPEEAVEVLDAAKAFLHPERPDWRHLQELGLARRDAGQTAEAIEVLESVLTIFTSRRSRQLPAETLAGLAWLYEQVDRPERAADLWRTAAQGEGDRESLVRFHREAARVVEGLGLDDEATALRRRAEGLAEGRGAATTPDGTGADASDAGATPGMDADGDADADADPEDTAAPRGAAADDPSSQSD